MDLPRRFLSGSWYGSGSLSGRATDSADNGPCQPERRADSFPGGWRRASRYSDYERAVFLFDGHDNAQVEAARGHWKALKAAGHTVTYWQQNQDRRWERKA